MSNKLFQGLIYQMKEAIDRNIGIIDDKGVIIACSQLSRIGESHKEILEEVSYTFDTITWEGFTYRPIGSHARIEFVVFVEGQDESALNIAALLAISFSNIKTLYDEKYDRTNFIKNIILDNILPGDIYIKSKELHFDSEINRVVYLIRFQSKSEVIPYDIIQNMFPDKGRDYVISVGETDIVLVKELKTSVENKSIESFAKNIVDTVSSEFYMKVVVGIGTVVTSIKELARSYKDAQVALEVGKVFDTEKSIISYENLGIGRLIYQLPATLCEMFLQEVFKRGSLESLDRETLMTIQAFFDNNLNVSETSRKLFVHRNTLVYRLEKIKKLTGLDLREFDHAITFKVALMVKKYLISKPNNY
ncbi:MAG: helix-turn-helix domain-containing protein [Eubacteriales bacterium]|nr:helix-turn-helix domain-containing protein [Eubacteriales bacterium]MDD4421639.1 helix-turn-helix domain-containing protein [Eubacteriales bacterium]HBR30953.1 CdaR family transcriptional regulator [Clostridiales bacterium]